MKNIGNSGGTSRRLINIWNMKIYEKMNIWKKHSFFAPWFTELQICTGNWRHPLSMRLIAAKLEHKEPPKKLMQSQPLHFLHDPAWYLCLDPGHSHSWWPELPRRATADLLTQNWRSWTNKHLSNSSEFHHLLTSLISLPCYMMLHAWTDCHHRVT